MRRNNFQKLVEEFHTMYKVDKGDYERPQFPNPERVFLRVELIMEEAREFKNACQGTPDFIEAVDALGDLIYVTLGAAIEFGVDMNFIMEAIQRSNKSKLDEDFKPIMGPNGKVMKGPNYKPPDILAALQKQIGLYKQKHLSEKS